jgi:hypothetical protein
MIGKVYNIPPQPPVAEHSHELPAGPLTFSVEYRNVDPGALRATYAANAAHLAELDARSPEGGFTDEGVSIHVCGTDDGHEYLRFDVFDDEPHYHYVHHSADGNVVNQVIDFDTVADGDMLSWAIERLRSRLPEMLTAAGGSHLAARLDMSAIAPVIDEVAAMAEQARTARRRADA